MALLALAKNPLKQERMLKELRRIGGGEAAFLAAFESELTDEEAAIDDQYRAGQGKVSSHENHRKVLLNHFDTDDLVYAGTRLMEMFDDTPERPDGLTSHDYKVWMLRIIMESGSTCRANSHERSRKTLSVLARSDRAHRCGDGITRKG